MGMNRLNSAPRVVSQPKVAGTRSFRLSMSKLFDYGVNLQNPAKPLMKCIVARQGHSFVQCDQAGAEALIVAHYTRPGRYRALFQAGIKPHTFIAFRLFAAQKPEWFKELPLSKEAYLNELDPVKLGKLEGWKTLNKAVQESGDPYFIGKRTCHARSYKMGWYSFIQSTLKDSHGMMVLSAAEAKRFLSMFDEMFPEIIEWQQETIAEAEATRTLRNIFGYPRHCGRIFTEGYKRELISFKPQSSVAIITHQAIRYINKHINENKKPWTLLNQKHDSILIEVPDADTVDAAAVMQKGLAAEMIGRDGVQFTMKADAQIGKNWAPFHPEKNPNGLKTR